MVTRARGRSLDELRVRASQALYARLEWLSDSWTAPRRAPLKERYTAPPSDRGIGAFAGAGATPEAIAHAITGLDRQISAELCAQSNAAESGLVTLLGHGPVSVGNPPRWHLEALSGKEAPRQHWSRIDHLDVAAVGDHKVVWELNRHQYLLAPAFCWLLEGESRRFDLIQSHLQSWLADNPPRRGINWVSSLELSLRAITWCWLLWMLRDAPWKPQLRAQLAVSLEAHGQHIERHLSTYFSPNTHLTGEALGLFYLGTILEHSRHASRWRRKGAAILESELARQVYSDGVYFEQASQYQRYTAEIYLHYVLLAGATGGSVSDATRDGLASLLTVLRGIVGGRGCMPLLGDDDGGLLLPLDHRPPEDLRALLLAGAVALNRPELIAPGEEAPPAYAYWLCGIERTDRMLAANAVDPPWVDMYFADGGLAVLRDGWKPASAVCVIDAGPHGALSCGHSHADALAVTLSLGATELFIDRGTFTYMGAQRNEFRSTASHNTLEIGGESSVTPGGPFKWLPGVPPRPQGVVYSSTHFSGFAARATGHVDSARPSLHRRRVLHLRGGAWVIHDQGVRDGARGGTLRWQLAAGLVAESLTPHCVAIRDHAGLRIATIFMLGASVPRIVTRDASSRLGQRAPAQCLELPVDASLEALTVIVPAAADGRVVAIALDGELASTCIIWADDGGSHRLTRGLPPLAAAVPPAHLLADADLLWCVDRSRGSAGTGTHCDLVAAMRADSPPAPDVPDVAQLVTDGRELSGKMIVLEHSDGDWSAVSIEEPRRGQQPG
jgi:hypothetical protein